VADTSEHQPRGQSNPPLSARSNAWWHVGELAVHRPGRGVGAGPEAAPIHRVGGDAVPSASTKERFAVWSCIDPWTRTNGGPHGERPAIAGGDVEPGLAQGHGDHHLTSVGRRTRSWPHRSHRGRHLVPVRRFPSGPNVFRCSSTTEGAEGGRHDRSGRAAPRPKSPRMARVSTRVALDSVMTASRRYRGTVTEGRSRHVSSPRVRRGRPHE
jgi:hypothetical protein